MAFLLITPPEYFPGPPVLAAAAAADVVVLADTYQYVRQSRQNRAAVRTPDGTQWLTIPLGNGQYGRAVCDCVIAEDGRWRARHLKSLRFNYGQAAFYEHYAPEVAGLLNSSYSRLGEVTTASSRMAFRLLGSSAEVIQASLLPGQPRRLEDLCAQFPRHDVLLLDEQIRADAGRVKRPFTSHLAPFSYRQVFDGFEPALSGLDLLFNHGPGALQLLKQHHSLRELEA